MFGQNRVKLFATIYNVFAIGLALAARGQSSYPAPNDLPNPFTIEQNWAQSPPGRTWGRAGLTAAPDGKIWAYDRCGANSCEHSDLPPILEFDPSGKLLKSFGQGLFVRPHGIYADEKGNIWMTDGRAGSGKGLQVFKFTTDGKVLMTLGKAGVSGEGEDTFGSPTDVLVGKHGDIFVSDGHDGCNCPNARIMKFTKDGKFLKAWGKKGTGPGEFDGPHALALDSQGRLFVADRTNSRIQIFDQEGNFIAMWRQFGRPSGIFIDQNDTLYVTDSESRDTEGYGYNPGVKRGIRIGSAETGAVRYFIPTGDGSETEGVAVDRRGDIYLGLRSRMKTRPR
jgi:sugar lactone lactonase YvrE